MKHYAQLIVRTYECDSYGHVNNAVYLHYLEFARMEFLKQIGFDYKGMVDAGYFLYVTHVDIHYKNSAVLDDHLTIEVDSIKLGAVSGTFRQVIRKDDGTVCAEAEVSWASVDSKTRRPSRIPAAFMVDGLFPDSTEK